MVNLNSLTFTLLAASATLITAQPVDKRAGGPAIVPIPSECSLISIQPEDDSAQQAQRIYSSGDSTTEGVTASLTFIPDASFNNSSRIYSWFADPSTFGNDASTAYKTCLEQCHGFGSGKECQSVYFAQKYPAEPRFGGPGGWLSDACIMFSAPIAPENLVAVSVDESTAVGAQGTNIVC